MVKKMKSPLDRRIPRQIREEFGKYAAILILLTFTIGFVSGFLVADGSMLKAYNESFEKYNIENGHFVSENELNRGQRKRIGSLGIKINDLYYVEEKTDKGQTLRIYRNRKKVNRVCLMEGKLPVKRNEICIDRMFADNNGIKVGDTIKTDRTYPVTGLVAFPDYSALFENNSDSMFDAVKFSVAVVSDDTFDSYAPKKLKYCYTWLYDRQPEDEKVEKDVSEELLKSLGEIVELDDYVPRFENQAIQFTGGDLGHDRVMIMVLLYILIAIIAFVFAVIISNTITKEAAVIGTLRALGYTKKEIIRHYMISPLVITVIGAVIGNVIGYTWFKKVSADLYYASYSLPTYVTIWNAQAFFLTTVIPLLLMLVITYITLNLKLRLSPLKFLRRELKKKEKQRVFPLSRKLSFLSRFRIRVIIQNRGNYLVLLFGIMFANLLLLFGLGLPDVLDNYQKSIQDNMISSYQYILKFPKEIMSSDSKLDSMMEMMMFKSRVETDNPDAEKFSAYSLNTVYENYPSAQISIYGTEKNSRYIDIDYEEGKVVISRAMSEKYSLNEGDTVKLKEKYEDETYEFEIGGIYDYQGDLCIFMPRKMFSETFDLGNDFFSGYFSDSKITDIDSKYISTVIDLDALSKMSRQLDVSMGSMMKVLQGVAILIFMTVIYLLSKIIIEKNSQSISMVKILGYSNREISSLYITATTIMVIVFIIISIPLVMGFFLAIYKPMMIQMMAGWLPLDLSFSIYVKMIVMGILTYSVVAWAEYRKVKKIPMDEALKNVE